MIKWWAIKHKMLMLRCLSWSMPMASLWLVMARTKGSVPSVLRWCEVMLNNWKDIVRGNMKAKTMASSNLEWIHKWIDIQTFQSSALIHTQNLLKTNYWILRSEEDIPNRYRVIIQRKLPKLSQKKQSQHNKMNKC